MPKRNKSGANPVPIIRASELNSYEYCHRSWWLRVVAGVEPPPDAQARLAAGTERHAAHGRGLWWAMVLQRAAWALLAAGGLVGAGWWLTTGH